MLGLYIFVGKELVLISGEYKEMNKTHLYPRAKRAYKNPYHKTNRVGGNKGLRPLPIEDHHVNFGFDLFHEVFVF